MKKRLSFLALAVCVALTACFTLSVPARADDSPNLSIWEEGTSPWTTGVYPPMDDTGPLPSGSGNGWSYDGPSHTLTLHNFRGGYLQYANIFDDTPVTIVLEGDNTVTWTQDSRRDCAIAIGKSVTIRGDGSLTVVGGMQFFSDLTLESGTIVTTGMKDNYCGLRVGGTLTVHGGSLTAAPGGGDESDAGIDCRDFVMTGGRVITTRTDEYVYSKAVLIPAEGVDPSDVFVRPYAGLHCSNINLSGGELSVTGEISCRQVQLSSDMVATCTLEGYGTQRFSMEVHAYSADRTDLEPSGKPGENLINLRNLPQTSITITSSASSSAPPVSTPVLTATPTASTVLLNGQNVAFDAYVINGNNYFKLRDLAYALSGTGKQFEVSWDGAANAIAMTSGQPYTPVGGELASKGTGAQTPVPNKSKVYLDGTEISLTAYTIQGNNYFKLRDLGAALDFCVEWDGANNTVVIDTARGYTPD